jgi:hypothetical protein
VNLVDCAEDHRRARWIDRLTGCPGPYRRWISASRLPAGTSSPSGLVVMSQPDILVANRADDISPSCSWRQGRVYFLTLLRVSVGLQGQAVVTSRVRSPVSFPCCWLRSQSCLMLEGRAPTLSGPSPALSSAQTLALFRLACRLPARSISLGSESMSRATGLISRARALVHRSASSWDAR